MKLTMEQLHQQNLEVYLQTPSDMQPKRVARPESVDIDTGTVEMWVIPVENLNKTPVVQNKTELLVNHPPDVNDYAVLKTLQGKVFVINSDGEILFESP